MPRVYTTREVSCGHDGRKHHAKGLCQECYCAKRNRETGAEVGKRYRKKHPERLKERRRKYKEKNPEKAREWSRKAQQRLRQKKLAAAASAGLDPRARWYGTEEGWRANRSNHLRSKYNLTLADYEAMHRSQGGLCAICRGPETATRNGIVKNLAVDHCHATGKIRGLLCQHCNQLFGHARESVAILRAAIEYLERSTARTR